MSALFLSASVPVPGRSPYYETANPFLIQAAVREFISATIQSYTIVWGGHPAITPMIWAVCEDLGVQYAKSVVLYQSLFFQERFPEENARFANTIFVPSVAADREASLKAMREVMLSRNDLQSAVFIGGMEGIEAEYELFIHFHPHSPVLAIGSPGGAARSLAIRLGMEDQARLESVDFAGYFRRKFPPAEQAQ